MPSYASHFLLPWEVDVLCLRQHSSVLRPAIFMAFSSIGLAAWLTFELQSAALIGLVWIACMYPVGRFAVRFINWSRTYYLVTNNRIILITGITTQQVDMVPANKITGVQIERDPIGRMLGYGTIIIDSPASHPSLQRLSYMPRPEQAYLDISAKIFGDSDD
jgi:membrane protein YdbS with pleckstrin-like domain